LFSLDATTEEFQHIDPLMTGSTSEHPEIAADEEVLETMRSIVEQIN
jgi:hypothetical protein